MAIRHILILGGTTEARLLAAQLAARGDLKVTLSLAGRTKTPLQHASEMRIGGFGGPEGLVQFLRDSAVDILVDATHPFAERISCNAGLASREIGLPLVALQRQAWEPVAGDFWIDVRSAQEAVAQIGDAPRIVFLTIGRQQLASFMAKPQHSYIIRSVEPVDSSIALPKAHYIIDRGPFAEFDERRLLAEHRVDLIVSRNSGGEAAYGKIAAARALGIPVIMIRRPSTAAAPKVTRVEDAVALICHLADLKERGE